MKGNTRVTLWPPTLSRGRSKAKVTWLWFDDRLPRKISDITESPIKRYGFSVSREPKIRFDSNRSIRQSWELGGQRNALSLQISALGWWILVRYVFNLRYPNLKESARGMSPPARLTNDQIPLHLQDLQYLRNLSRLLFKIVLEGWRDLVIWFAND